MKSFRLEPQEKVTPEIAKKQLKLSLWMIFLGGFGLFLMWYVVHLLGGDLLASFGLKDLFNF